MYVTFHPLVQKDVDEILHYCERHFGRRAADTFYEQLHLSVQVALKNPKQFHFSGRMFRRFNLDPFPYHFLYREISTGIQVMVVKHNKRHPRFGLRRK